MKESDFEADLDQSNGSSEEKMAMKALAQAFPGRFVRKATVAEDMKGADFFVEVDNVEIAIDVKFRKHDCRDFGKNDVCLEIWANQKTKKLGWTRDDTKITDGVLWVWKSSGRWALYSFSRLWFLFEGSWADWRRSFGSDRQRSRGKHGKRWKSESVFVPAHKIETALVDEGNINEDKE